jgi:hypothetical protein
MTDLNELCLSGIQLIRRARRGRRIVDHHLDLLTQEKTDGAAKAILTNRTNYVVTFDPPLA